MVFVLQVSNELITKENCDYKETYEMINVILIRVILMIYFLSLDL